MADLSRMLLSASLCLAPQAARAGSADQAVEQFRRICLAAGPNFDHMIVTAADRHWTVMAETDFADLAPVASPNSVRAWLLAEEEEGLPAGTIIGVTRASLNDKPVQTCTLALPNVDHEAFRKSFFERTDAEKIADDRDTARVSRLCIVIAGGREQFVRLVDLPSTLPGNLVVVASSIMAD